MTIYLYVKQHSITGLKYFGKTESIDPFKYNGSGIYWINHTKKHGRQHIKTIEIWGFDDINLCKDFALKFSEENNIVESKDWANLKVENGLDGNPKGFKFQEVSLIKMRNTTQSEEHRNKMKIINEQQFLDPIKKKNHFNSCNNFNKRKTIWINNGMINKRIHPNDIDSFNLLVWKRGRLIFGDNKFYQHGNRTKDPITGKFLNKENI